MRPAKVLRDPVLLTVNEAGEIMKCDPRTVFQLIARGILVRAPKFGKQTVVYADSVYAALDAPPPAPRPPPERKKRTSKAEFNAAAWIAKVRARRKSP